MVPLIAVAALSVGVPQVVHAEPSPVGTIVLVSGQILGGSGTDARQLRPSMTIMSGEAVQTGPGAEVSIAARGGATLNVGPGSAVSLSQTSNGSGGDDMGMVINLTAGSFHFASGKLGLATYTIQTPTGVLVANDAVISIDVAGGTFAVVAGSVQMQTGRGRTVLVSAGQAVTGVDAQGEPIVQAGAAYESIAGGVTASLGNGHVRSLQPGTPTLPGQGSRVPTYLSTISIPTPRGEYVSPN